MLSCGQFQFDLTRPLVMGIVNVTPDSFSDGGRQGLAAIEHARQLIAEGANILDIGGESTRPGATPVSIQEELDRVLPVIEGLRDVTVALSIDTFKPEVMRQAIHYGVSIVNDINALQNDTAMQLVVNSNVGVCLMHKQGESLTMQINPSYRDVISEVVDFLTGRVKATVTAGVARQRIIIDPGFGFGKSVAHNFDLLKEFNQLTKLGVPVLAGLSRKSMLGAVTGGATRQRVGASVAGALIAVQRGASIVRVHDVQATVDALKVWNAINGEIK